MYPPRLPPPCEGSCFAEDGEAEEEEDEEEEDEEEEASKAMPTWLAFRAPTSLFPSPNMSVSCPRARSSSALASAFDTRLAVQAGERATRGERALAPRVGWAAHRRLPSSHLTFRPYVASLVYSVHYGNGCS